MNYWAKRVADTQTRLTNRNIKQTETQLRKYYAKTMKSAIEGFENTYNKLLAAEVLGKAPTPADLYKLDKYWELQQQIRRELRKLGEQQLVALSKKFELQWWDIYYCYGERGGAAFSTLDTKGVEQLLKQVWCADGKHWSERIWGNVNALQQELNDSLIECVAAGRKPTQLKKTLQERFNVSYSRADALVRTEMAHIQTQAAQQRYKDYGIEQVEVFVDEDERTCPICSKHEGERHNVNDTMPIPFHPRCRCCVVPVID